MWCGSRAPAPVFRPSCLPRLAQPQRCDARTRQPKNEAFARTSFLHGANAAYVEEMQAQYERNPGSVSDEWRHFFASLQEESKRGNGHNGPSWAKPLEQIEQEGNRDLLAALTGDYD